MHNNQYIHVFFCSEYLSDSELSKRLSMVNESEGSCSGSGAASSVTSPVKRETSGVRVEADTDTKEEQKVRSPMSPVLSDESLSINSVCMLVCM